MRSPGTGYLAFLSLALAATVGGCATNRRSQRAIATQPAAPPTTVATAPSPDQVRLVSFEKAVKEAPSAPEEIDAVGARAMNSARPSLPLDLPNALGLTQAQNPRVAFAQA